MCLRPVLLVLCRDFGMNSIKLRELEEKDIPVEKLVLKKYSIHVYHVCHVKVAGMGDF